jgi:hypothetical protein
MRTDLNHLSVHVPHHASRWWLGHVALTVALSAALLYAAAVLLVFAGRMML